MKSKIKTPWYKYYDGVKEHLDYPDISAYNLVEKNAKNHMNNISYEYFGVKKTYKQFLNEINDCAKSFKKLGVNYKDVVSICMPNTPEAIISFYALNKIGAIANMIHPLSAEKEIKYFINLTNSKYIITIDLAFNKVNHIINDTKIKNIITVSVSDSMPIHMKTAYKISKGRKLKLEKNECSIPWKKFINNGKKYDKKIKDNYKGNDTAAILYSGGTTGYPKGIELTNLNFNALAMQCIEGCANIREKDSILAVMPIFHGFGLGVGIHTFQQNGGTSILLPQFDSRKFDKLIRKYKPNIIVGVPTLFEALLNNNKLENFDLSFLRCAISGGDSLSVSLRERFNKFLKEHNSDIQIREGYGMTESVTASCLTPVNYYREGSVGIPYPDTYYKIVKPNTIEELPYNEEGEITVSGPSVMKGYLKEKEETDKTLKKHKDGLIWLHTGDIGYMDEDGFVYFKQRLKRVIMSSGYCIYPQYIENIIDSHKDVLTSCVIGMDHPYKVQVAKVYIVLKKGIEKSDKLLNEIKKYCEKDLAKYSWPYEYEFIDELPKTLVGKVAYKELEKRNKKNNI